MQGDPDPLAIIENDEQGARPHNYTPLFASFPNLTALKVSSDCGVWHCPSLPPPSMPKLRHIYLYDSDAGPKDLGDLLPNAPELRTLCMTPTLRTSYSYTPGSTFGIALTDHTNLGDLNVHWRAIDSDRVTSLAEVQSLRSLCIQMDLLCGNASAALETPLIDLLPSNLVELTVKEWRRSRLKPRAVHTLMQFARDVRKRLHDLKKVVLLCETLWILGQEGEIKTMFLEQGVEFSVELDDV